MCKRGKKHTLKANNSRVNLRHADNNLHNLRNVLQVKWNDILAHVIQSYVNSIANLLYVAVILVIKKQVILKKTKVIIFCINEISSKTFFF